MNRINFDEEIRLQNLWRRQFMNAFAAGSYADMPLSGHRSCTLAAALKAADGPCARQPLFRLLAVEHDRFHALCAEILDLSENGMAGDADMMLPELADASHRLVGLLDEMRTCQRDCGQTD